MGKPSRRRRAATRATREQMGATGANYTTTVRARRSDNHPAIFDPGQGLQPRPWDDLLSQLDEAEAQLDDPDMYRRAAAFAARAAIYNQLYAQTTDPVYAAACVRAALLDEASAAEIRFVHRIPTILPGTMAHHLRIDRSCACGRPWLADPAGACPNCPQVLFGPTPADAEEAARFPAGEPVL